MVICEVCGANIQDDQYAGHVRECSDIYASSAPILERFFPFMSYGFSQVQRNNPQSPVRFNLNIRTMDPEVHDPIPSFQVPEIQTMVHDHDPIQDIQRQTRRIDLGQIISSIVSIYTSIVPLEDPYYSMIDPEFFEPVRVGMSDLEFHAATSVCEEETSTKCTICQSDVKNTDVIIRKINKCQHKFCHECIKQWLDVSKKCPLCNCRLDE